MSHFPGHQQALIKDNLVVAVLSFPLHESIDLSNVGIAYDSVVDLCQISLVANNGDLWNGTEFLSQPHQSWTVSTDRMIWVPPVEKPIGGDFVWSEDSLSWIDRPIGTANDN